MFSINKDLAKKKKKKNSNSNSRTLSSGDLR